MPKNEKKGMMRMSKLFMYGTRLQEFEQMMMFVPNFTKSIHLKGIDTNRYAVYQTVKTISTGKEYIKLNEIADESLIDEKTFQVIVHSILLAKYGTGILGICK